MQILDDVKSWMGFMGWTDGGSPGSVKRDAEGKTVAKAGDNTWVADVEEAIEKAERQRIVAELERRESSAHG